MLVTGYWLFPDFVNGSRTMEIKELTSSKILELSMVINDKVKIQGNHQIDKNGLTVIIDNSINNHNEILNALQGILKESL